jgi:hypothetical protein
LNYNIELDLELSNKIIISDFGLKGGVHTFRINGLKHDLERLVDHLLSIGVKFKNIPTLENAPTGRLYSVLLKIVIPQ